MSITSLTPAQLRKAADLKEKIAKLEQELGQILGSTSPTPAKPAKKGGMSAAGKAKVSAAQKKRWAKVNAGKIKPAKVVKQKRKISVEGLARIKAAQKARWAKVKAEKK